MATPIPTSGLPIYRTDDPSPALPADTISYPSYNPPPDIPAGCDCGTPGGKCEKYFDKLFRQLEEQADG